MNPANFQSRLTLARDRRCPVSFIQEYFNLDLAGDDAVRRDFEFWMRQRHEPAPIKDENVDRWWFEKFLQQRQLIPLKWAALQLGMTHSSILELRQRMSEQGPQLVYHRSQELVGRSFEEDLLALLPKSRSQTFADHNGYCRQLHLWLAEVFEIEVNPEYCATSVAVGCKPPDFAKHLDILTLQPLGPRYQVWLDFGKWMTLAPDRCSILTYAEHQQMLEPYAAGREAPVVPPEVNEFLSATAR